MRVEPLMKPCNGFTLIEMAITLLIVTLLLGGLIVPLSAQIEQRKFSETQKALEEIKEALIGYAIIHGSLPCPSTETNPNNAAYGVADTNCQSPPIVEGYVPWKTLGVSEMDAWGIKRTNTTPLGYWRYRAERNFSNAAVPFTLSTGFIDGLIVKNSAGNALTTATERPVAIIFSTGPNTTSDGLNISAYLGTNGIFQSDTPSTTFDDLVIWISRPLLMNRMVAAGKLP